MGAFGDGLKRERERRKISLEDIAGATKIGVRFLRALEEEHFDQLPGGVFNKGFLRAYARHVGIDEEQVVADYLEASGEGQPLAIVPEPAVDESEPEPSAETNFEIPWNRLAIALMVIAFAFAVWGVVSHEKGRQETTQTPPVSASSQRPSVPAAQQPSELSSSVIPVASQSTARVSTPAAASSRPSPSGNLSVLIKAHDECWVSITTDGKKSEITLQSGDQHPVAAASEIVLKFGNVGAVDLWFNGKPLPAQGAGGQVKTLAFDVHGLRPAPPKPIEETAQP